MFKRCCPYLLSIFLFIFTFAAETSAQNFTSSTVTVIPRENCRFETEAALWPASDGKLYIFYTCLFGSLDSAHESESGMAVVDSDGAQYYQQTNDSGELYKSVKEIDGKIYMAAQYVVYSFDMTTHEWSSEPVIAANVNEEMKAPLNYTPLIVSPDSFYTEFTETSPESSKQTRFPGQVFANGDIVRPAFTSQFTDPPVAALAQNRLVWRSAFNYGTRPIVCSVTSTDGECIPCQALGKYAHYTYGSVPQLDIIYGTAFRDQFLAARWEVTAKTCKLKIMQKSPLQNRTPINSAVIGANSLGQAIGQISNGADDYVYWKSLDAKPVSIKRKLPRISRNEWRRLRLSNTGMIAILGANNKHAFIKYTRLTPIVGSN